MTKYPQFTFNLAADRMTEFKKDLCGYNYSLTSPALLLGTPAEKFYYIVTVHVTGRDTETFVRMKYGT